jgi:hypothetical protein
MGDINAARMLLMTAATTGFVCNDFTPLRFAIENVSRWINLITGETMLKFSDISIEDSELRDVWMLQGNAFKDIYKGNFNEAAATLKLMKERQRNQGGSLYYSVLLGYFGVRFYHYSSVNTSLRDECVNAVILGGRKLCARKQATPIGILCLFLSAYSALIILLSSEDAGSEEGNLRTKSYYRHRGGGEKYRLENVAKGCLKEITSLSRQFPLLVLLKDTLTMLQSCVSASPLKNLNPNECPFPKDSPVELYHEFALGCAFWCEERERYCAMFGDEDEHKEAMLEYVGKKRSDYKLMLGGM